MSKKPKRGARRGKAAGLRRPKREFSDDGEVEIRGDKVYFHGELADMLADYCKRHQITLQQLWEELFAELKRKFGKETRAASKPKPAKARKPKGNTRAARG